MVKTRRKPSKSGKFVLALSLTFITMGLSLLLCSDVTNLTDEPVAALVSETARELASTETPAEPAEEPETRPDASAPETPSAPAQAPETPVAPAAEPIEAVPPENEAVSLPADGPFPAAVSAAGSPEEKTPDAANDAFPPPGAVDSSEIDDYFSDALFIGDSRTQGLLLYSNLGNAGYYAARGLTVEQVFKKPVVDLDGGKLTVSDALGRRAFGKVYLMFGLNELGWNSIDKFIETYGLVLDRVKETQPDAVIYVQAIMPVSARKSERDAVHNNPNIERFNERILQLAEAKNAIYLNVGESVADENGVLPEEASSDGIHLNRKYCVKWEEYLRSHEI